MDVVAKSASLVTNTSLAKVNFDMTTPKHVYGHLTNGFSIVNDTAQLAHAWTATGGLKVTGTSLGGSEFGFVQLQRVIATGIDYCGVRPEDGSIRLLVSEPSAMPNKLALDSKDTNTPWTRPNSPQARFQFTAPLVQMETGDHPAIKVLKMLKNDTTKKINVLRSITDKREFWTLFTMKDAAGNLTYHAHFHWTVSYVATFKWASGNSVIDSSTGSGINFGKLKEGKPTDSALTGLLNNPVAPQANDVMETALKNAVANGQSHNRTDYADQTCGGQFTLPADFFT